mgnify:CR=1 FL=1
MPHIDEHSGNDFETVTNPDWQGLLRHTVMGIHLLIRKAILGKKNFDHKQVVSTSFANDNFMVNEWYLNYKADFTKVNKNKHFFNINTDIEGHKTSRNIIFEKVAWFFLKELKFSMSYFEMHILKVTHSLCHMNYIPMVALQTLFILDIINDKNLQNYSFYIFVLNSSLTLIFSNCVGSVTNLT